MVSTNPAPGRTARWPKHLATGVLVLILAATFWDIGWTYSGSGKWTALPERDGVRVYYLKRPGTPLIEFRGVTQVRSSLRHIVSFMRDPSVCQDVGCYDSKVLAAIDPQHEYEAFTYRYPPPFEPRQFVVMEQVTQSAKDNSVEIAYLGVPFMIPAESCCVRVPHMNDKWRFTPLPGGLVRVEYHIDQYEGGLMPAFYSNRISEESAYEAPGGLVELMNSPKYIHKYQDQAVSYIKEGPPASATGAAPLAARAGSEQ